MGTFIVFFNVVFTVIFMLLFPSLSLQVPVRLSARRTAAREINKQGPYIGLIMADQTEENTLLAADVFLPSNKNPWLDFSGRRFNIGSINGQKIIYVRCGQRRLNAGVTTQTLIDIFDIAGILHYGTAGNANNSHSVGDVSIPKYFAYTGSWKWMGAGLLTFSELKITHYTSMCPVKPNFHHLRIPNKTLFPRPTGCWLSKNGGKYGASEVNQLQHLHFGDYDVPLGNRTNLLSSVDFQPEEFFSENSEMQEIFWMEATQKWFHIASKLEGLKLEACVNSTFCLPETPKVVVGLKASSADIFVDNAAFRDFLFNHFQVATVDQESAAIAMICLSSNVPVIVFRGLSDLAGGDRDNVWHMFGSLAAKNALTAALAFLSMLENATEAREVSNPLQFV